MINILGSPPSVWLQNSQNSFGSHIQLPKGQKQDLRVLIPNASTSAINLMEAMLRYIPENRITSKLVLRHAYLISPEELQFQRNLANRFKSNDINRKPRTKESVAKNPLLHNLRSERKHGRYHLLPVNRNRFKSSIVMPRHHQTFCKSNNNPLKFNLRSERSKQPNKQRKRSKNPLSQRILERIKPKV